MSRQQIMSVLLAGVAGLALASPSAAQSVEEFYKGKSISLIIGTDPGGGYDQYARTLARHLGRFIPGNPTVIPRNLGTAGGVVAANRLFSQSPKDGTEIGAVHRGLPILPLVSPSKEMEFDPAKFGWLGSLNKEASICMSWHTSKIKTFADTRETLFIVGVTGVGASLDTFEAPLMNVYGSKMKIIAGYRGGQNIDLAMERGEIDGRCGVSWSSLLVRSADWFREKKINILLQFGLERHADLKDIPLMQELATTPDDRTALELISIPTSVGRPYLAPPGVPKDRLAALQNAFNMMVKDEGFMADANKQRMEIQLVTGEEVQSVLSRAYGSPQKVIDRSRELMKVPQN
jgi:tripartite-type tricarboxylate transporter receptor subunit TctC